MIEVGETFEGRCSECDRDVQAACWLHEGQGKKAQAVGPCPFGCGLTVRKGA